MAGERKENKGKSKEGKIQDFKHEFPGKGLTICFFICQFCV